MAKRTGLRRPEKKRRGSVWLWFVLLSLGAIASWFLLQKYGNMAWLEGFGREGQQVMKGNATVRGAIYDRNYKPLAISLERVSVYARTREIENPETSAMQLAPVLELDEEQLVMMLGEGSQRIWLVKDISQEQEDAIRDLNLPGVYLHRDFSRFYPEKTAAAHLVGFAEDGIGLAGIEYYYDRLDREVLAGEDDYHGRGEQQLVLTLDMKIQRLLEDMVLELRKGRSRAKIGAYVMDSSSGALVGAAQFPAFNPNTYRLYTQDVLESLLVKPMVLPEDFRVMLREASMLKSQYDARGTVLPWSVSMAGQSLGTELRLWESLGLENPPSDEFVIVGGQSKGGYRMIVKERQRNMGTVPEMVSPLNLMSGMSGLLNGGRKVLPHIGSMLVDGHGGKEYLVKPEGETGGAREVVPEEVSREFSFLFSRGSEMDGLGAGVLSDDVTHLGTTGQSWDVGRNSVCMAALPVQRAEVIALVTVQENGAEISTREEKVEPEVALTAILPRVAVLQQVGKGLQDVAEPAEGESGNFPATLDSIRDALKGALTAQGPGEVPVEEMPDVVGLSLRKALRALQDKNCKIRVFGTGEVKSQEPAPGTRLTGDLECTLKMRQEDVSVETYQQKVTD